MQKTRYYIRRENRMIHVTQKEFQACIESKRDEGPVYMIRMDHYILEVPRDKYMEFYRDKSREQYLFRQAAIYQVTSYNNMDTDEILGIDMIPDESVQVEDEVIRNLQFEKLHRCIKQLPPEDEELIRIAYFEEMSEREMAKLYGISQPAIHKRKMKILFFLKKLMEI